MTLKSMAESSPRLDELADFVARAADSDDPGLVRTFVRQALAETDAVELHRWPIDRLGGMLTAHWKLGATRPNGVAVLVSSVGDPDPGNPPATVVMSVMDDVPFLVDSVRAVLTSHGLGIHLTIHPMLDVRRDSDGRIVDIGGLDGVVEAWTIVEFDAVPATQLGVLQTEIASVLSDVRLATADREPMRLRTAELAERVRRSGHPDGEAAERFLTWLTRQHFVFLGVADYLLHDADLVAESGRGLGLLGRPHRADPPMAPGRDLLSISRADAHATVHRDARLTCVAVRRFGDDGEVIGEHRIEGLFSAAAARERRRDPAAARQGRCGAAARRVSR